MRRRDLLTGSAGLATVTASGPVSLAAALFRATPAEPAPVSGLAAQIAAAQADFRSCRYSQLARRLPGLISQASSARDAAGHHHKAAAAGQLAHAYCLASLLLCRMHDDAIAAVTADRAMRAATDSGDPLTIAASSRVVTTALRHTGHRDEAQDLALAAAQRLHTDSGLPDGAHAAQYGQLLAVAAYTAAMRDHRDTAVTLLDEARDAIRGGDGEALTHADLAVYRISVARVLGDFGAAVDHARHVDPTGIPSPERRARFWEDTALALHGRGRPQAALRALQAAEHDAPQEVRYRPWAQQLTTELLRRPGPALPGIREFAARVGVPAG